MLVQSKFSSLKGCGERNDPLRANKWGPFLIIQPHGAGPRPYGQPYGAFDDPDQGEDSESECGPMDEFGRGLVCEDGEEGPGDGDGGGEVAFWGGECVGCCCAFKEEEGKENKDLCPDACGVVVGVDAECIEGGEDDEDGCPAVV